MVRTESSFAQKVHRVKDHVSFLIRTGVAGDNLRATTDDDLVNIAPHPNYRAKNCLSNIQRELPRLTLVNLMMGIGHRHRVVIVAIAHHRDGIG